MKKQDIKTFKNAVENTADIASSYRSGLQALGADSAKINIPDNHLIGGSVDIDTATKKLYPTDSRWDYAFDYNGEVFYIEVHPAYASEIQKMEEKLKWLKNWLQTKAPAIKERTAPRNPYCWIQSGRMGIPATTSYLRRLAQLGLKPVRSWSYPI